MPAAELEIRLEALVDRVLNSRRSVEVPAAELARYDRQAQQRFLNAVERIAGTAVELAFNFCMFAVSALELIQEQEAWDDWVLHLMDIYDQRGVMPCITAMGKVDEFMERRSRSREGLGLEEVAGILERFVCALSGRYLKLAASQADVYTDTETLYLPARLGRFEEREGNFRLYKATAVHLWAQTRFGTWRSSLAQATAAYDDPQRALQLFHALETIRLDACVARELPGVYRQTLALREAQGVAAVPDPWRELADRLQSPGAGVTDSLELLATVYCGPVLPDAVWYQGMLLPQRVEEAMAARKLRERNALRQALAVIAEEHSLCRSPRPGLEPDPERFEAVMAEAPELPDGFRVELRLQGEPVTPSHDVRQLLDSIVQDFGAVPQEYLQAAGYGRYRSAAALRPEDGPRAGGEEGACVYDEWDYVRQHYRKDWCVLRSRNVHPQWDGFAAQTLAKHRGLLKHLYRTFEALRGEDRSLRRQPFGDDIDIDAVVDSFVDQCVGLEASDRLFKRKSREERDIAVMFMVDMSGSTKGWINDMEREALVLLCESLEILGDRYAIYGFSGFTHKRCELMRIKGFDEPYSDEVRARISGIRPQDYTRMGVAIRHLSKLLGEVEARTRLLITLSDGRPDDQDGYRGAYGIEDTRQALLEARHLGIHPFCITIDDEAQDYLPHMYGPVSFTVVSQVEKLPFRVSDIYRRITG